MINPQQLNWEKCQGLIPAIVQHHETGEVLMLGFMNEEALVKTLSTGLATFYSRSKQRLWTKGETSGNTLTLITMVADCDQDTLLLRVRPSGNTCHLGKNNCFTDQDEFVGQFIQRLEDIINMKKIDDSKSYTATLFEAGIAKICQKVGEESIEIVIAALTENRERLCEESADFLYHLLVLLQFQGLHFKDVVDVLKKRRAA